MNGGFCDWSASQINSIIHSGKCLQWLSRPILTHKAPIVGATTRPLSLCHNWGGCHGDREKTVCHLSHLLRIWAPEDTHRHIKGRLLQSVSGQFRPLRAVWVVHSAVSHHEQAETARRRVGGISSGSAWLDSGLGGSVCLFDKKSSVRKENKQSSVLLLQSQRKSCY